MKILMLADEEVPALWDYYRPGMFDEYDLILAAGDLKGEYLTFIETLSNKPLIYVPGNHDKRYEIRPPEGCINADDDVVTVKGVRIAGLGGCAYYNGGQYQYTESEMEKRIWKLRGKIRKAGGIDIILTHAAPKGLGDDTDYCHRGFAAFLSMMDVYKPKYLVHGHVHLNYGQQMERIHEFKETTIINAYQRYEIETEVPMKPMDEIKETLSQRAISGIADFTKRIRRKLDFTEDALNGWK